MGGTDLRLGLSRRKRVEERRVARGNGGVGRAAERVSEGIGLGCGWPEQIRHLPRGEHVPYELALENVASTYF